jgi:RNA polymerase sigma-70 factor (ECF subfamily)
MMELMAGPMVAVERGELDVLNSFDTWMVSEQARIFRLCLRFLRDQDEADSATQDVFLKAYQALRKEDAQALADPARWLARIAVNTCLDRLRSKKWQLWRRRPDAEDEELILRLMRSNGPEAEDRYFARQIEIRLGKALDRLSGRQRAVFTLRHYQDLSLEEISKILDLDVGTVKAHMFRAVSKLREELRDLYEGSYRASNGAKP